MVETEQQKQIDDALARKIRDANIRLHNEKAEEFDREEEHMHKSRYQKKTWEFVDFITDRVESKNPKFLDLGCGTGNLSLKFLERGYDVTGVDISEGMLEVYKRKTDGRAEVVLSDIDAFLENTDEKFDVIAFSAVLHHLPDYRNSVLTSGKVLKDHGLLFINYEHLSRETISGITKLLEKVDVVLHGVAYKWKYHRRDFFTAILRKLKIAEPAQKSDDILLADFHVFEGGIKEHELINHAQTDGFTVSRFDTYQLLRIDLLNWFANVFKFHGLFSLVLQKKSN